MKKGLNRIIILLVISACNNSSFQLFDVNKRELANVNVPGKKCKLRITYLSGNATSQNCIQVSKQSGDSEEVLQNYERYNYLEKYQLLADTSLLLILRDTISYLGNKPDTMFLKLH
jgi:ABC-type Fe3+-hydroxamate transport system substrate-binding protein